MQTTTVKNHKADRQLAKREAKQGARYARQKVQKNEGPNVRIRVCKASGHPYLGYHYIRVRDGKEVQKMQ